MEKDNMKKIITLLITLVTFLGLTGVAMATTGGHFSRTGVTVDISTTGYPIMNTVDAEFTYNGETKTATGTPNPNGPVTDAWDAGPVTMKDGTKFKIKNGKVYKKSPGDRTWMYMYQKKSTSGESSNPMIV